MVSVIMPVTWKHADSMQKIAQNLLNVHKVVRNPGSGMVFVMMPALMTNVSRMKEIVMATLAKSGIVAKDAMQIWLVMVFVMNSVTCQIALMMAMIVAVKRIIVQKVVSLSGLEMECVIMLALRTNAARI